MENKDLFAEFNNEDLNKLFDMSQFDAFADMDIPSFESINDDFKAMEKNLKSEFEPLGDSYDFDFDFDFDSDFGFKELEKEFNQQFKESVPSKDTFQKIFTRKDEAERKRAVKDIARKEKEKLAKAEKQALAKIKAEKAAAKAAKKAVKKVVERTTPKAIEALCQKYYAFVDKVQRRIDDIEGERIEAQTQRYIVAKYKKAEKVKTPAKAKVKETPQVDFMQLAKNRFSNAYYTWAVVWDQLDEERELRAVDKLTKKHNKEVLQ